MTTLPDTAQRLPESRVLRLPPHTADVHRFVMSPGSAQDAAVTWARGVLGFADTFGESTVIRAAKVLEANDQEYYHLAVQMRRFLEGCAAERAARVEEVFEGMNVRRGRAQTRKNLLAVVAGALLIALAIYLLDGLGAMVAATVAQGADIYCGAC